MSVERFLVTGGFFDGSSEGYIGELSLRRDDDRVELAFEPRLICEPPEPKLRVVNKGFTGGSLHNGLLWLCSPNQVLGFSPSDYQLVRVIDDPGFNDLHHVLAEDHGLTVVNTGLESLDETQTVNQRKSHSRPNVARSRIPHMGFAPSPNASQPLRTAG